MTKSADSNVNVNANANANKPRIQATPNGPYLISDPPPLVNSKREPIATRPTTALCRCGRSANKPFCDGTHSRVDFSGARTADGSADKQDHYEGKALTVNDNRGVCAHLGYCTEGLPAVFKYGQEPWIDPNGEEAAKIEAQVRKCPSGALTFTKDGAEQSHYFDTPEIMVTKNGPYRVVGGIELEDSVTGQSPSVRDHYTLCRCGGSKNKPFCDGAHWNGFEDDKN